MDIHGRIIMNVAAQNGDIRIDLSGRENGLYFVSVRDGNGDSKMLKVVKLWWYQNKLFNYLQIFNFQLKEELEKTWTDIVKRDLMALSGQIFLFMYVP